MAQNTTVRVESPNVKYTADYIESEVDYQTSFVTRNGEEITVVPVSRRIGVQTARAAGRVGVMIVGWGGNNGSTLTAALLAHRRTPPPTWRDRRGEHSPNWYGSVTQCGTVCLGVDGDLRDVYAPLSSLLPFARPQDIVVDGWDINDANLGEAMRRARVLEPALQDQLYEEMSKLKPRPGIYKPDFIADNQSERANNVLDGSRMQQYERIRADIREFRAAHRLDSVLVLWTANTERLCTVVPGGVHDTSDGLDHALMHHDHDELSPSTLYALAAVDEGCVYINGSPQNSVVPGVVERARLRQGAHVAGDDFKTGQTKLKSVLVDYLVQAGIKPVSIVSYNHLGNNDGKNLSAPKQFHSKEVSKRSVVDDMVESNRLLYREGERPDHTVVIQYVPYVGDVKRAMDEYVCELMLGGTSTLAVYSTCEDSLLATAIMLDLVLVAQLLTRMRFRDIAAADGSGEGGWERVDAVLSPLGYWLKAPLEGAGGGGVVNALGRQRALIDNLARLALALPPNSQLRLEQYVPPVIRAAKSGEMQRAAAAASP